MGVAAAASASSAPHEMCSTAFRASPNVVPPAHPPIGRTDTKRTPPPPPYVASHLRFQIVTVTWNFELSHFHALPARATRPVTNPGLLCEKLTKRNFTLPAKFCAAFLKLGIRLQALARSIEMITWHIGIEACHVIRS